MSSRKKIVAIKTNDMPYEKEVSILKKEKQRIMEIMNEKNVYLFLPFVQWNLQLPSTP